MLGGHLFQQVAPILILNRILDTRWRVPEFHLL